ncbi:MAG: multi protein bridging factor 1-domain-containing protein [Monoraphidium minutum]|nr:MAG: multi protein bridging factor 1-domain-containing protein [Monoraphidium minutum]
MTLLRGDRSSFRAWGQARRRAEARARTPTQHLTRCLLARGSIAPASLAPFTHPQAAAMNVGGGQDWDPVVLRKKPVSAAAAKDEKAVNAARRAGLEVETSKKQGATSTASGKAAHKLDNETEDFNHERVSTELKKQIIQARTAKKLTQAQLGQLVNEKPSVIQEYESGKAIPNPQVLSKMSRVLGVTLKKNPGK